MSQDTTPELTPREHQCLRLISEGMSNKLIADALNVSDSAVKFHIKNLARKLKAKSRAHAVALGYQIGILSLLPEGAMNG